MYRSDYSANGCLAHHYSFFNNVQEGEWLTLKKFTELVYLNQFLLWVPEEERRSTIVLELFAVQKNFNSGIRIKTFVFLFPMTGSFC